MGCISGQRENVTHEKGFRTPTCSNLWSKCRGQSWEQEGEGEGSRSIVKGQAWEIARETGPGLGESRKLIYLCFSRCFKWYFGSHTGCAWPILSGITPMPVLSFFSCSRRHKEPSPRVEHFETERADLGIGHLSSTARVLGLKPQLCA